MRHVAPPTRRMAAAARLYHGPVMHQRLRPVGHRFTYRVFSLLIDIDRLDEADRLSPLFSVNKRNLAAFMETDHIRGSTAATLRGHVDNLMRAAGRPAETGRVLLACYPRMFGLVFNPLSVFYVYDRYDALTALIYQVRNTFGEDHTYVCPIAPGEQTAAGIRQHRRKRFYVSPFIDMEMTYHFRMNEPGDTLRWRILETDAEGPLLSATYSAVAEPLCTKSVLRNLARVPLLPLKIVAGIHFEALRLWLKGVAPVTRQPAGERISAIDIPHPAPATEPANNDHGS
ncbi:DUF1365 domain-containing protein [Pseudohoeflea coraliihabitans]|uniref:DUF1365 domain-containing protein n=1 Tax=Pseudohoeflea coraliihabitans TaxID=2860393 RepID=A0ABS6WSQ6_9HYPH|nr:DUF1365 domain-containing protein [Pseudohoeflea sp. DP4N28-3]MBW3098100.1 DUF1365 domain-containing protein [Pseudohoeflea sp. DP4N28-3]